MLSNFLLSKGYARGVVDNSMCEESVAAM